MILGCQDTIRFCGVVGLGLDVDRGRVEGVELISRSAMRWAGWTGSCRPTPPSCERVNTRLRYR